MRRLALSVCVTTAFAFDWVPAAAVAAPPQRLAIYYGYPTLVEGAGGDVPRAVRTFAMYDAIVLGDGLELGRDATDAALRAEYTRLTQLVPALHATARQPALWGYIDLGRSQHLTLAAIAHRIDAWKQLGVGGIFFDEAGRDFGVTAAHRRAAVRAAHDRGLAVFMNAFDANDLFEGWSAGRSDDAGGLGPGDALLIESFAVREGVRETAAANAKRAADALAWRTRTGVRVFATTTAAGPFDAAAFEFAWRQAAALGVDGFGWGEPQFSADTRLPWHERPREEQIAK
jgi:hypothetical protein